MNKVGKYYPRTERDYKPTVIETERDEVEEIRQQAIAEFLRNGGQLRDIGTMLEQLNDTSNRPVES